MLLYIKLRGDAILFFNIIDESMRKQCVLIDLLLSHPYTPFYFSSVPTGLLDDFVYLQ